MYKVTDKQMIYQRRQSYWEVEMVKYIKSFFIQGKK